MQEQILTTGINSLSTIAETLKKGLIDTGRLLGDKTAYISMESEWERYVNEGLLGEVKRNTTASAVASAYRLALTFEDKSTVYFTLRSKDYATAALYAPHLVQEVVDTLKLNRVIWQIAGSDSVHFASYKQGNIRHPKSLFGKLEQFKMTASQKLAKFFFNDEEEY
ncbi:hypothetical protein ACIQYL_25535 [Lysinibacillus xylanilyticus]|uniref:hypothetical protein n=1 Tax=Lysinibacillus xylanilyticus TaxID=582475 RepID=UPI00382BA1AB